MNCISHEKAESAVLVKLDKIEKRLGSRQVIHQLSVNIGNNCYWVEGENGSGKSTLGRIIAGLCVPDAGVVEYSPETIIGYAAIERGFAKGLKCHNQLKYIAKQKGLDIRGGDQVLSDYELVNIRDKRCGKLSTGEAQRLRLALSMIGNPTFLILDEVHVGLDESGLNIFSNCVFEVLRQGGGVLCLGQRESKLQINVDKRYQLQHGVLSEISI